MPDAVCPGSKIDRHQYVQCRPVRTFTWVDETDGARHQVVRCKFCADLKDLAIRAIKRNGRTVLITQYIELNTDTIPAEAT